jgi:hypothetical protein
MDEGQTDEATPPVLQLGPAEPRSPIGFDTDRCTDLAWAVMIAALPVLAELITRLFAQEAPLVSYSSIGFSLFALSATALARRPQLNALVTMMLILAVIVQVLCAALGSGKSDLSAWVWIPLAGSTLLTLVGISIAWWPWRRRGATERWV